MDERARRVWERIVERDLVSYVRRITKDHHVLMREILSDSRKKGIVIARQALWRALHDEANLSWSMVGEIFEKKHDSIVHATSYKESRAKEAIERPVIEGIAAYVRDLGYVVLAKEIEAGKWRKLPNPVQRACVTHEGLQQKCSRGTVGCIEEH